jgi:hypothetical protein
MNEWTSSNAEQATMGTDMNEDTVSAFPRPSDPSVCVE